MRRATDGRKVWYEWLVESSLQSSSVGSEEGGGGGGGEGGGGGGRGVGKKKVRLGCSEVGSSRENGCTM